jgi:hypothetical protein
MSRPSIRFAYLHNFINRYLANERKETGDKDYLTSKALYALFNDIDIATLEKPRTGRALKKAIRQPSNNRKLLKISHYYTSTNPSKIDDTVVYVVAETLMTTICNCLIFNFFRNMGYNIRRDRISKLSKKEIGQR